LIQTSSTLSPAEVSWLSHSNIVGLLANSHGGRKPSTSWTRPPGRPRRTWLNLVQEDAKLLIRSREHDHAPNGELRFSGSWGGAGLCEDDDLVRRCLDVGQRMAITATLGYITQNNSTAFICHLLCVFVYGLVFMFLTVQKT